jgi:hypothetical protein
MTRKLLALALVLLAAPASAVHLGDFPVGATVDFMFNTRTAAGAPITFAGTPSLTVYRGSNTTEDSGDITLVVDYDTPSITGMHHVTIATGGDPTFYVAGDFQVVVVQGTVNGQSVAGQVVASFSLNNRSALRPATAGRTVVVSASGVVDAQVKGMDADTLTASAVATSAGDEIADETWDEPQPHNTASTMGALLTAAGGAADPLANTVPGSYLAGTAGYNLGLIPSIKTETDTIGEDAAIVFTSPVTVTGDLQIVPGDAYDNDHSRAIDDLELTGAPSLTGATVKLVIKAAGIEVTATSITGAGGATQTPIFELTAAQTTLLTRTGTAAYHYQIQATWAADTPTQPAVLAQGKVAVQERYVP